ncbi:MAG: adenylyl-sulfate kinase [Ardenticatenaceae bacterium]|nr:adenylyl-sulfate kinase [Ardenticatenaceae bacterium]
MTTFPPPPGFVLWLTGLPASGKTTLAYALRQKLAANGVPAVVLDSDELRRILTPQPSYDAAERDWFYGVLGQLAGLLAKDGVNVLVAATANRRRYRDQARQQLTRFAEVYVRCDLATCQQRDPKGIYAQAQSGTAVSVPGVGSSYEPPTEPEIAVDTTLLTADEAATAVYHQLTSFFQPIKA